MLYTERLNFLTAIQLIDRLIIRVSSVEAAVIPCQYNE